MFFEGPTDDKLNLRCNYRGPPRQWPPEGQRSVTVAFAMYWSFVLFIYRMKIWVRDGMSHAGEYKKLQEGETVLLDFATHYAF